MHFLIEARYRGAHLVVVSPDYNATAVPPIYGSIRSCSPTRRWRWRWPK
jgi:hypothetical protein